MSSRACAGLLCAAAIALAACGKSESPAGNLKENVERTVGEPQASPGALGGNDAPADGGAAAQAAAAADAGCGEGRTCGGFGSDDKRPDAGL